MPRRILRDFNTALRISGPNQYTDIKTGFLLATLTNSTVSAWIKAYSGGGSNGYTIYSERALSGNDIFKYELSVGTFRAGITHRDDAGTLTQSTTGPSLRDGSWHHVVWVKVGTTVTVYLDNVAQPSTLNITGTNTFTNTNPHVLIGADFGDSNAWFNAGIDNVRLFNRALSAAEVSQIYFKNIAPSGQVAAYLFDEGSGTVANDSSGNGLNGTITGATFTTDVVAKQRGLTTNRQTQQSYNASYKTTGGYVNIGGGFPTAVNTSQAYTVIQWMRRSKIQDTQGQNMMGNINSDKFWFNWNANGNQRLRSYHNDLSPASVESNISITDNEWHKVAATFGAGVTTLYIDGVQVASQARTGTLALNTTAFYVGSDANFNFPGFAADAALYTRALTSAEILQNYRTSMFPTNGLYGRYILGEGTGTIAYDSSGNNNNGTITNGAFSFERPKQRRNSISNHNLIYNSGFEFAPRVNVPQTGNGDIDCNAGTSGNRLFGYWANAASGLLTAQFDTTTPRSGLYCMKGSTISTGQNLEIKGPFPNGGSYNTAPGFGFDLQPSTSYTLTYWMRTNYTSGDSNGGAFLQILVANGVGTTTSEYGGTMIKTTTGWTQYTINFTTTASQVRGHIEMRIYGGSGAGTLIMDAWWDDLLLRPSTPIARALAG